MAFILDTLSDYLGVRISRQDVLSCWSGIRPLPSNPKAAGRDTASIVRDHGEGRVRNVCVPATCAPFLHDAARVLLTYTPPASSSLLPAVIYMDDDGLLNVTGGKWTTYRRMAQVWKGVPWVAACGPSCIGCVTYVHPCVHGFFHECAP